MKHLSIEDIQDKLNKLEEKIIVKEPNKVKYETNYEILEERMSMFDRETKDYNIVILVDVTLSKTELSILSDSIMLNEEDIIGLGDRLYSLLKDLSKQLIDNDLRKREIIEGYRLRVKSIRKRGTKLNIFADDIRDNLGSYKDFKVYRTYESLLDDLRTGKLTNINCLTLDHDMGVCENGKLRMSGSEFIVKLIELMLDKDIQINNIKFHTSNVVGFENMQGTLIGAIKRGFIKPIQVDKQLTNYLDTVNRSI